MRTIESLRRPGIDIEPGRTIEDAARAMEHAGVGALAVVDGGQLVGIVTDRDLVRRGIARGLPLDSRVDSVMSTPVVTIEADADLHSTFALFRAHAIRRLVVVLSGKFVGMLTVDDLMIDLAADLSDLSRPVAGEVIFAERDAPLPVPAKN